MNSYSLFTIIYFVYLNTSNIINHILFRKICRKKQKQNQTKQAAKKSEDHHRRQPLVININVMQKHKRNSKRKATTCSSTN